MWPFKKKPVVKPPVTCQHKWKDFPWYIQRDVERDYNSTTYLIRVWQPYVCVKCKERRDESLETVKVQTRNARDEYYERMLEDYKDKVLPIAVVEDMVKDEQLVDREYLRLMDDFQNPSSTFDNIDLLIGEIGKVKDSLKEMGGDGYAG